MKPLSDIDGMKELQIDRIKYKEVRPRYFS